MTEFWWEDLLNQQPPLDVRRSVIHPLLLLHTLVPSAHFSILFSSPSLLILLLPDAAHPLLHLWESNHSSSANQKEEESIKHHSGNLSPGSWCYEPCSGEGRGVTGELYCSTKVRQGGDSHGHHVPRPSLFSATDTQTHCSWTIRAISSDSGPWWVRRTDLWNPTLHCCGHETLEVIYGHLGTTATATL